MDRVPVVSSHVAAVGYLGGVLEVEYTDGSVYHYDGVSGRTHQALMASESIGGYLHRHIRGAYPQAKVEKGVGKPQKEPTRAPGGRKSGLARPTRAIPMR